ncbi:hypothetical protein BOSE127_30225 [Bosea sp. 127]|nr:hypothetical protein BOSE127_30225 [Bosea sp. 127]
MFPSPRLRWGRVRDGGFPPPPACGGKGLGMGGRKAGTLPFIASPSGTAPHPNPPHRKRGEGERRQRFDEIITRPSRS